MTTPEDLKKQELRKHMAETQRILAEMGEAGKLEEPTLPEAPDFIEAGEEVDFDLPDGGPEIPELEDASQDETVVQAVASLDVAIAEVGIVQTVADLFQKVAVSAGITL